MVQQLDPAQFGKPTGTQGEEVGKLMADGNQGINSWTISLLGDTAKDNILEIGFGPGVGVQELIKTSQAQFIAGIDHSEVMLTQATERNSDAIDGGRLELSLGSVSALPYQDTYFDKVFTVNSFHFWPEPLTDLAEIIRVMKPKSLIAITVQPRWATSEKMVDEVGEQLVQWLEKVGFESISLKKKDFDPISAVCVLGIHK